MPMMLMIISALELHASMANKDTTSSRKAGPVIIASGR
jgi:hypothetical protein